MMNRLSLSVLVSGLDDWVPLAAIEGLALKYRAPENKIGDTVVACLRQLSERNLVELGEVSDEGFFAWNEPASEALDRIADARTRLDSGEWGFCCWVCNKAEGDDVARTSGVGSCGS